jgi:translation initiation factor IF-3
MDFGKKLYEEKKQKAEAKKKQHQVQIKEVKFRPGTEEGDYQIKLRNRSASSKRVTKRKYRCVSAVVRWRTRTWVWN